MIEEVLIIVTLVSIWLSLLMSMVTVSGASHFWLKRSKKMVYITPLKRYPKVTIVVPAHNEELVIAKTARAILGLNYPAEQIELLIFADNCSDLTASKVRQLLKQPLYRGRNARVIERTGKGGKAEY